MKSRPLPFQISLRFLLSCVLINFSTQKMRTCNSYFGWQSDFAYIWGKLLNENDGTISGIFVLISISLWDLKEFVSGTYENMHSSLSCSRKLMFEMKNIDPKVKAISLEMVCTAEKLIRDAHCSVCFWNISIHLKDDPI